MRKKLGFSVTLLGAVLHSVAEAQGCVVVVAGAIYDGAEGTH